nr:DUF2267 domain-containing protein [Micromonospora phytophila]
MASGSYGRVAQPASTGAVLPDSARVSGARRLEIGDATPVRGGRTRELRRVSRSGGEAGGNAGDGGSERHPRHAHDIDATDQWRRGRDLATQLPEEFRGYLHKEVDFAEQLDLVEFLNEVRARTGLDDQRTADGARAVLITLREAVSAEELEDLEAELPKNIRQLLYPVGRGVGA